MTVTNVHKAKLVEGFLSHWRYMGKRTAAGGSACFLFSSFCFLFFEGQNCFFVSFPQYVSAFVPAGVFFISPHGVRMLCCVPFRPFGFLFYFIFSDCPQTLSWAWYGALLLLLLHRRKLDYRRSLVGEKGDCRSLQRWSFEKSF